MIGHEGRLVATSITPCYYLLLCLILFLHYNLQIYLIYLVSDFAHAVQEGAYENKNHYGERAEGDEKHCFTRIVSIHNIPLVTMGFFGIFMSLPNFV